MFITEMESEQMRNKLHVNSNTDYDYIDICLNREMFVFQ